MEIAEPEHVNSWDMVDVLQAQLNTVIQQRGKLHQRPWPQSAVDRHRVRGPRLPRRLHVERNV